MGVFLYDLDDLPEEIMCDFATDFMARSSLGSPEILISKRIYSGRATAFKHDIPFGFKFMKFSSGSVTQFWLDVDDLKRLRAAGCLVQVVDKSQLP